MCKRSKVVCITEKFSIQYYMCVGGICLAEMKKVDDLEFLFYFH